MDAARERSDWLTAAPGGLGLGLGSLKNHMIPYYYVHLHLESTYIIAWQPINNSSTQRRFGWVAHGPEHPQVGWLMINQQPNLG